MFTTLSFLQGCAGREGHLGFKGEKGVRGQEGSRGETGLPGPPGLPTLYLWRNTQVDWTSFRVRFFLSFQCPLSTYLTAACLGVL
ncbi:unnamed protein product [Coregonus sp. 'balchen']|nr:unnamed protein product [Coregonus sp. 'balchen']